MSIITISRGSYSRGKEVAEKVAEKLGYECISREIILEASDQFNIPEIRLVRAIHDAPSLLDRFSQGRERYISTVRAALLKHVKKDNVVYHGLAGQFFLQEITHAFKVRILADIESRVREEMKRENISAKEARFILKKDDEERRKWGRHLYGLDPWDANLYDMVLHIGVLTVDDAVDIIANTSQLEHFRTTQESQRKLNDLALAAEVKAALMDFPEAAVSAKDGMVFISLQAPLNQQEMLAPRVENVAKKIAGVRSVEIRFAPF